MTRFGSILGEIHRRSVWQILGSYAVGAWLVLQFAETLSGLIGLPLWFGPAVIGVVLAGVPLVLVTSLVQGGRGARAETAGPAGTVDGAMGQPAAGRQAEKAEDAGADPSPAGTVEAGAGAVMGPGGTSPGDSGPAGAPGRRGLLDRTFTWRNLFLGAAGAVALLVAGTAGYSTMRVMGLGPVGTLLARGVLEDEERVILADFANRTDDPALGETVTALFRIDIAQSPTVTVLEPSQLGGALARMERDPEAPLTHDVAVELAEREGVKAVLSGEVLPLGRGAALSMRLVAAGTGETLVALRESARVVEDIPDAVDRLSAQLRERIGESLRSIRGEPPLEQVTTGSLEALRLYARALEADDRGDLDGAVPLLERAIAQDSTFAMAYRKLGVLLTNENMQPDRFRAALTRAFELRDRLTERERLLTEAAYYTSVEDVPERAERAYEEVLERHPADYIALNNLAVRYHGLGRREEALALHRRQIDAGGASALTYQNVLALLHELGRDAEADATLAVLEEDLPGTPRARFLRAALLTSRFQHDEALELGRPALEAAPPGSFLRVQLLGRRTDIYLVQGRLAEVLAGLDEMAAAEEALGAQFLPADPALMRTLAEAVRRGFHVQDWQGAAADLERRMAEVDLDAIPPGRRAHLSFATIEARGGRVDEARSWLAGYQEQVPEPVRRQVRALVTYHGVLAEIALAEGRYEDALADAERMGEPHTTCRLCGLELQARVRAAVGDTAGAISAYERYVNTPMFERAELDGLVLFDVYEALGTLYAETGDMERSRQYYARFLELWEHADPELLPRIQRVRAALRQVDG